MPWNGTGTFSRNYSWVADKNNGINITASRMDADTNDIVNNGLNDCLTRDGQGIATANLPMGGFRHTGVGNGVARTDYSSVGQLQDALVGWASTAGTGDAITATYSPAHTVLTDGMVCWFRATASNTITAPTFSPDGLTAHAITTAAGKVLAIGALAVALEVLLRYNLANTRWEMLSLPAALPAIDGSQLTNLPILGGATVTSPMSSNLVLTSASKRVQSVAPNAAGLAIQLPDATTIASGGASIFVLENIPTNGFFPVQIIDSASNLIGWAMGRTLVHLDSIATATGNWRLQSGDKSADQAGLNWWGASSLFYDATNLAAFRGSLNGGAGVSAPQVTSCMTSASIGIAYFSYNAGAGFTGLKLTNSGLETGAFLAQAGAFTAGSAADSCYNGASEVIFAYSLAAGTEVESVTINTSTLALTSAKQITGVSSAITNCLSLDSVAGTSGLVILGYTDPTSTQVKMLSYTGTGASFAQHAGSATIASPAAVNSTSAVALLSSTLAYGLGDTSGSVVIQRVTIAAGALTGGNSLTIASRDAVAGQAMIVRVDATHALAVYTDSNLRGPGGLYGTQLYGNVITDATTPTGNETSLWVGGASASIPTDTSPMMPIGITRTTNGKIIVTFSDGINYKWATVGVVNGAAVMSTLVDRPVSGQPLNGARGGVEPAVTSGYTGQSNVVIQPILTASSTFTTAVKGGTYTPQNVLTLQPLCVA